MPVEPEVRVEAGLLPFEAEERQRERPWLEDLQQLERQTETVQAFAHQGVRRGTEHLVERLSVAQHAAGRDLHLRLGRQHLAEIDFFHEEV